MKTLKLLMLCIFILGIQGGAIADSAQLLEKELQSRMEASGTLDLYDKDLNKVRSLSYSEFVVENTDSGATLKMEDLKRRQFVMVNFILDDQGAVSDIQMGEITEMPPMEVKKFTDEEVLAALDQILQERTEADGYMVMYDIENEKLRKLEKIEYKGDIRNFGKLYISSVNYKDMDTEAMVTLDVTLENDSNELIFKSIKIKKIQK